MSNETFYTLPEVAKILRIPGDFNSQRQYIYKLFRCKKLGYVNISSNATRKNYRVSSTDLNNFITNNKNT